MNLPLLSVIVLVNNGEKYVDETLETILARDSAAKEIIVENDGAGTEVKRSFNGTRILNTFTWK